MAGYVIDASVILKWVLGDRKEPDQEAAVELLTGWAQGRDNLLAPTLWEYEVANFLGRELPDEAEKKMEVLRRLEIRSVVLTDTMIKRCFQWMKTKKVAFYDASYLAVAVENGAVLVAADEKFVKKMGKEEPVTTLKDLA
jgi:predicted nucleic acid-binding protein